MLELYSPDQDVTDTLAAAATDTGPTAKANKDRATAMKENLQAQKKKLEEGKIRWNPDEESAYIEPPDPDNVTLQDDPIETAQIELESKCTCKGMNVVTIVQKVEKEA